MSKPEDVLDFWLSELGPEKWYNGGDALDAEIRDRFEPVLEEAKAGACGLWLTHPLGTLAYVILTDQLPRNMYRNTVKAFATDKSARAAAKIAITRDWDVKVPEPARQFFYMPLVHSENLIDQDRAVRLFLSRMPETGQGNLLHAKVHREIIRMFGRFPFRNEAMSRETNPAEAKFLAEGGYQSVLQKLQDQTAA